MFIRTFLSAVAAALVLTSVAAAHVTLNPQEWEAGGFARFAVRVPNESENADTIEVTVRFPQSIISASFQPLPGWERSIEMEPLDQPIEEEGEQITEHIASVTWTGGRIAPGEFEEFGVSFRVPETPGQELVFPAIQTYSDGEVVRWIGPPDSEEPAPRVMITEPQPEEAQAAPPASTPAQGSATADEESSSDTLSIIALIAGIAGLATGLVALFWRGRRPEVTGPHERERAVSSG